jgi:hypothetical protein
MKVKLYMDVWQGWTGDYASAIRNPIHEVGGSTKRLSFTVEVPDHLIQPKVDFHIQETSVAGEVK